MAKKLNISDLKPFVLQTPVGEKDVHYIQCKVLIVCEGEETEPNYFRSFGMMRNASGLVFEVKCEGGGINTMQVVNKAIELRDKAESQGKPYDTVWAVFDKDSFNSSDFDNAILKAEAHHIGCAWSNEAFELWYVYHFDARCTEMPRSEYKRIITQRVKAAGYKNGTKPYVYKKNDERMRSILLEKCNCSEKDAIKRARDQRNKYTDKRYHTHNPCTTVDKLVSLLIGEDKNFNRKIENSLLKE